MPDPDTSALPHLGDALRDFETELHDIVVWLLTMSAGLRCGSALQRNFLRTAVLLGRIDQQSALPKSEGEEGLAIMALRQITNLHGRLAVTDRRAALVGEARNKVEHYLSGYDQTVVLQ